MSTVNEAQQSTCSAAKRIVREVVDWLALFVGFLLHMIISFWIVVEGCVLFFENPGYISHLLMDRVVNEVKGKQRDSLENLTTVIVVLMTVTAVLAFLTQHIGAAWSLLVAELDLSTGVDPLFGPRLRQVFGIHNQAQCWRVWYKWCWLMPLTILLLPVLDVCFPFFVLAAPCTLCKCCCGDGGKRFRKWAKGFGRKRLGISMMAQGGFVFGAGLYLLARFLQNPDNPIYPVRVIVLRLSLTLLALIVSWPGLQRLIQSFADWSVANAWGKLTNEVFSFVAFFADIILDIIVLMEIWNSLFAWWIFGLGCLFLALQYYVSAITIIAATSTRRNHPIPCWQWATGLPFAPLILSLLDVMAAVTLVWLSRPCHKNQAPHNTSKTAHADLIAHTTHIIHYSHSRNVYADEKGLLKHDQIAVQSHHGCLDRAIFLLLAPLMHVLPLYKNLCVRSPEVLASSTPQRPESGWHWWSKEQWEGYKSARLPAEALLESPLQAALQATIYILLTRVCRDNKDNPLIANDCVKFGAAVSFSVVFSVVNVVLHVEKIMEAAALVGAGFWAQVKLLLSMQASLKTTAVCECESGWSEDGCTLRVNCSWLYANRSLSENQKAFALQQPLLCITKEQYKREWHLQIIGLCERGPPGRLDSGALSHAGIRVSSNMPSVGEPPLVEPSGCSQSTLPITPHPSISRMHTPSGGFVTGCVPAALRRRSTHQQDGPIALVGRVLLSASHRLGELQTIEFQDCSLSQRSLDDLVLSLVKLHKRGVRVAQLKLSPVNFDGPLDDDTAWRDNL